MSSSNVLFQRTAGALMPLFSLPGAYGIGVLGKEARNFADLLLSLGLHCWQVLPMVHAGAGNSPYSGVSAFAGDPLYIDPETLHEDGLITKEELLEAIYPHSPHSVDYKWLSSHKMGLLRKAFSRITPEIIEEVEQFKNENHYWLYDYALYLTMKDTGLSIKSKSMIQEDLEKKLVKDSTFSFHCFVQYEFYKQWNDLKRYCNEKGIGLIGDLPFYVSYDSSDVWANPHLYLLDKSLEPIGVAGTPPDYFSEEGQSWGNPLYDWKAMKKEKYDWWVKRIAFHLKHHDALRIDHFRGFEKFWYIPNDETKDARKGHWEKGPGLDLFEQYEKQFGSAPIIAEDLGTVDDNFYSFLEASGFPGMRVMQFAFDGYSNSHHLPHNYIHNSIAYTGTHDNNTTLGWIWDMSDEIRSQACDYCHIPLSEWGQGGYASTFCRGFFRTLYQSVSSIAIAPIQDFCGYGSDTRINIPGKPEDNWKFRFTKEQLEEIDATYFLHLSNIYKRNNAYRFLQR